MNDGQVHTIGSLDTFLNREDRKAIAERIARSRQTAGVKITSRTPQNKLFCPTTYV